eukprot:CAMPEP_0179430020 /NCGR_PEP_ID=MMETSP0799-20121207/15262_1 /TAXON_ID=46947 /ORGANISM="Geminigera cryophila, Strain CCMP2564" /LENGTH=133 /DNA_ID=CAMNT_0021206237 /DNA_START=422 /DNA_END=823 /DNA_ORIENTATION=+
MNTPRAFANGGVVPAGAAVEMVKSVATVGMGATDGRERSVNTCLIMCGGYNVEGLHLKSAEVAQTPQADVFFPLASLTYTRVLGTLAEATQWGKRKVLVIGGFNEHQDVVETVETLPSKILFDVIGEITVLPE